MARNRYNFSRRALGAATANNEAQMGAATTRSNEGVNTTTVRPRARRRTTDPMWAVNALISRKFNSLPSDLKSTDTKLACAKAVIGTHTELCPDMAKYFTWLLEQARRVRRTFDFEETCEGLGVDPQFVSEHIVLLGKAKWQKVQLEGLAATIPASDIRMYGVTRLAPEEYDFSSKTSKKGGYENE